MQQEHYPYPEENEDIIVNLPREGREDLIPTPTSAELELVRRRELAVQATAAVEEVLDEQVTVPELMRLADANEATPSRLRARRALRCVYDIGVENSPVVAAVGETNLYHYVEGVLQYGSSRTTYLGLMEAFSLTAEEATGLYALRELIADESDGKRIGFPSLRDALSEVGISMKQAANNPDAALAAFVEADFFVNYNGSRVYDQTIFSTKMAHADRKPGHDFDSIRDSAVQFAWIRDYVEDLGIDLNEDKETE